MHATVYKKPSVLNGCDRTGKRQFSTQRLLPIPWSQISVLVRQRSEPQCHGCALDMNLWAIS
jgi:hypothetical protein